MADTLSLDFETASDVDLVKVGLDVYSQPSSNPRVLMAAYRINDGPLQHWEAHKRRIPAELVEAIRDPKVQKWAFNAQFERTFARRVLGIPTPIEGWRCTMVLAYMQSFTGGLAEVGEQVGLPVDKQKLKTGRDLIYKFTMPLKLTTNQPNTWRNWVTDPDDWEDFCEYNRQDVIAEEAIKNRLIRYPIQEDEWRFYELDQHINDAGMPLDHDFITNLIWMAERRKRELLDEMADLTGLFNPGSVTQLLPWLQYDGYPFYDLRKESVEKALARPDVSNECAVVLKLRQWASKTSISKAQAARRSVGAGNRVRFMYQFAGAGRTNRFSGRNVQPQNMTRTPKMLDPEDYGDEKLTMATNLIREGDYDGFDLFINEPMEAFTGCMRSMFRAPEGYEFKVCDYSSVETAGAAWLAGCERLLNVFRDGRDPYKDFGVALFKKPYEAITRAERNMCKPGVLGCSYRLSAGEVREDGSKTGLLAYAENMGISLTPEESTEIVRVFRKEAYPEIEQLWYAYEKAVRYVLTTGKPYDVGPIRFKWMKPYLLIRLPSGRHMFYYKPKLVQRTVHTGRRKWIRSQGLAEHGAPAGQLIEIEDTYQRLSFTYMGRNQRTTQWDRVEGHGGVTLENIDQALTRDILKVGMQRLHAVGYDVLGHSHDEAITMSRIGDNKFTLDRMREIFAAPIDWAPGFPLKASSWAGPFYRK